MAKIADIHSSMVEDLSIAYSKAKNIDDYRFVVTKSEWLLTLLAEENKNAAIIQMVPGFWALYHLHKRDLRHTDKKLAQTKAREFLDKLDRTLEKVVIAKIRVELLHIKEMMLHELGEIDEATVCTKELMQILDSKDNLLSTFLNRIRLEAEKELAEGNFENASRILLKIKLLPDKELERDLAISIAYKLPNISTQALIDSRATQLAEDGIMKAVLDILNF